MGKQNYKQIIERLREGPGVHRTVRESLRNARYARWNGQGDCHFRAVAALSGNSAYDKYNAGDNKALSDSEKRGLVLFGLTLNTDDEFKPDVVRQKAKCTLCHPASTSPTSSFITWESAGTRRPGKFADLGRWAIDPIGAKFDAEPRGVQDADGSRSRAHRPVHARRQPRRRSKQVVEHYDKGVTPNPSLDPDMKKLKLTAQEKADVVAFMKALSGETKKLDELLPKLPPGPTASRPIPGRH